MFTLPPEMLSMLMSDGREIEYKIKQNFVNEKKFLILLFAILFQRVLGSGSGGGS